MKHDFDRANYTHNKAEMEKYYIACAKECRQRNDDKGYKQYMELVKCLRENMK